MIDVFPFYRFLCAFQLQYRILDPVSPLLPIKREGRIHSRPIPSLSRGHHYLSPKDLSLAQIIPAEFLKLNHENQLSP